MPSFSVGGDAMTAADPDTDEVDDDDEDGSWPLSRPRTAGASGVVCLSSAALAGAMARRGYVPWGYWAVSAAVAQLCGRKKTLDEPNSVATYQLCRRNPRGPRK